MSRGALFTPADLWWYAELHQLGRTIRSIAVEDGRSTNAVHQALIRIGRHTVHNAFKAAEELRPRYARYEAPVAYKTRPCMCCERVFQSEGIHNRLCGDCRRRDEGISSHAVATGRPSRGVRV